jgi:hypothetical protein
MKKTDAIDARIASEMDVIVQAISSEIRALANSIAALAAAATNPLKL